MQSENQTRQMIYKIVDENYGDRITDFSVDHTPRSGAVASGNFSTPRLGGKKLIVDYVIKDNGVTLTPRNLEIIDFDEEKYSKILESLFNFAENVKYTPLELYNFAAAAKCEKGWTCGKTCLSKTKKNCHQALNPEHKTYVGWLKAQVEKGVALHEGHRDKAEKLGLTKAKPKEQPKEPPKAKTEKQRALWRFMHDFYCCFLCSFKNEFSW